FLDLKLFVRIRAADALGHMRIKDAAKELTAMLAEPEATARAEYVRALVRIGGRDAVPALLKAAANGSWDAREPSMIGVAMLGDERELGAFEKFAKAEEKLTVAECKENSYYAGCDNPQALVKKHQDAIARYQK